MPLLYMQHSLKVHLCSPVKKKDRSITAFQILGRVENFPSQQLPQNTSTKSISKMPVAQSVSPLERQHGWRNWSVYPVVCMAVSFWLRGASVTTFPPSTRHEDTTHLWQSNVSTLSLCIARMVEPIITHTGVYAAGENWARRFLFLEASWNEKYLTYTVLLRTGKLFYLGHWNPRMCSLWTVARRFAGQCLHPVPDVEVGSKRMYLSKSLKCQ